MREPPSRLFDELSRVMTGAVGLAQGVQKEADSFARSQIERILRDAARLNPFAAEPHVLLAQLCVTQHRWDDALAARAGWPGFLRKRLDRLASKGELLRDAEGRARRGSRLPNTRRGQGRPVPIHRGLLQPAPLADGLGYLTPEQKAAAFQSAASAATSSTHNV